MIHIISSRGQRAVIRTKYRLGKGVVYIAHDVLRLRANRVGFEPSEYWVRGEKGGQTYLVKGV